MPSSMRRQPCSQSGELDRRSSDQESSQCLASVTDNVSLCVRANCRVLRLREGAALEVCDGSGTIAAAFLKGIGSNRKAFVETSQEAKTVGCCHHAVGFSRELALHGWAQYGMSVDWQRIGLCKPMHSSCMRTCKGLVMVANVVTSYCESPR